MSEVAGKIATRPERFMLEKPLGGRGVLLGRRCRRGRRKRDGDRRRVVGMNAAVIAIGMQADVFVLDRSVDACASSTSPSPARASPSTRRRSRSRAAAARGTS